jgi:chemotaxis protein CheX
MTSAIGHHVERHIEEISEAIWSTLCDLPLTRADGPGPAGGAATGDAGASTVSSLVHIEGTWQGAVLVQLPLSLATALTAAMLQGEDEPDADEVRDAIGEVANMLAGNLKALLPQPSRISLPAVVFGRDYRLSLVGTTTVAQVTFTSGGAPVVVSLFEHPGDRGGSGEAR